jgi:hypothetical protein
MVVQSAKDVVDNPMQQHDSSTVNVVFPTAVADSDVACNVAIKPATLG